MREKQWRIQQKKAEFNELAERLKVSPYLVRIMRNRGLQTYEDMHEYLYAGIEAIPSPWTMKGMKEGTELLKNKISEGKKIHIIGDYDVDGICSTAILYLGLKGAGARVTYRLPHRMRDGYGMNMAMVDEAYGAGVDTILTCDNGIAANAEIDYAKSLGMTVMVTDHHTVQEKGLPLADVIINPHQEGETYAYHGICGCVVAWKVMLALYELMGLDDKRVWDMIELAGLATVQDAMDLIHENRVIVKETLNRIKNSGFVGLRMLIEACELKAENIKSTNLAFGINPCLNAGGRLDSADESLELLLCEDEAEAKKRAEKLRQLNESRKSMQEENIQAARFIIETTDIRKDKVLVVVLENCHESLAGLVAGKLKEYYFKPCIVLTASSDGNLKGSGRSIPAYHMFNELQKCSDLLTKFGGHPMAAGLSLKKESADELRRRLNENCSLTEDELIEKIFIDMVMPPYAMDHNWIAQLDMLEPSGNGNEKPSFGAGDLIIEQAKLIGQDKNHLKLTLRDDKNRAFSALSFFAAEDFCDEALRVLGQDVREKLFAGYNIGESPAKISLIYEPLENEFRGVITEEMKIKDYHLKLNK